MINCIAIMRIEWLSNYLFVFGLSACDICNGQLLGRKWANFGDTSKTLIISCLDFIDTILSPKTGLRRPKRAYKRATVATQQWPFRLLTVALLQARRARMEKSAGFFSGSNPVFRSGWRILPDVFLSILFGTVRPLAELPFTCFCWCAPHTYYSFSPV